eukprot:gene36842-60028_t
MGRAPRRPRSAAAWSQCAHFGRACPWGKKPDGRLVFGIRKRLQRCAGGGAVLLRSQVVQFPFPARGHWGRPPWFLRRGKMNKKQWMLAASLSLVAWGAQALQISSFSPQ